MAKLGESPLRLGNSGLLIPRITLGTALTIGSEHQSTRKTADLVNNALKRGMYAFDTANNYGLGAAEVLLGKALKRFPRHSYIVSSKGSWPIGDAPCSRGLSRSHLTHALSGSRQRLAMESIDIYYAHRFDPGVPMTEVVKTFNCFIRQGAIAYWGVSEWPLDRVEEAVLVARQLGLDPPIANQIAFSFLLDKAVSENLIQRFTALDVSLVGYSPLAQGLLTGKYRRGVPPASRISKAAKIGYHKTGDILAQHSKKVSAFLEFSDEVGIPPAQLALSWALSFDIPLVAGVSKVGQLSLLGDALQGEPISDEHFRGLEQIRSAF